jgi:putative transposase
VICDAVVAIDGLVSAITGRQRAVSIYPNALTVRYPVHDQTIMVTGCAAAQSVGVTQVGERIWLVTFMKYDLGYFDDEMCRLEPIENPFGPKVLPIRSE